MRPMKVPSPPPRYVTEPAPEPLGFRFDTGATARSLAEFHERLREAPPQTVWYHRAHFVPWLREVVGDDPLARRVEAYAQDARDAQVLQEILADLVRARVEQLDAA